MLLSLIGLVIAGGVTQSLRATGMSRDRQKAAELLDRTLTKIDAIGPARLASEGPTSGSFDAPDDRFQWSIQIDSRTEADLYDVRATVSWPGAARVQSASVHTYLYDPPGSRLDYLQWENL